MRARLLMALALASLSLAPTTTHASGDEDGDEGKAILQSGTAYSYIWDGSRITPAKVSSSARHRKNGGIFLAAAGSVAMILGAGLMIGEAAVKPRPGEVKVWSKTGCWISFGFGMALVPLGLHAAIAGIAMLARGRSHDKLASIMNLEGPGPAWMTWHSTGKGRRILGSVMMLIGSGFLTMSLVTSVPHYTCDRWECNAWPEVGEWLGAGDNPTGATPIIFAAIGIVASALGLTMMVSGYAKQAVFLKNRHNQQISLGLSPGGLSITW